jgi:hypothetical protein
MHLPVGGLNGPQGKGTWSEARAESALSLLNIIIIEIIPVGPFLRIRGLSLIDIRSDPRSWDRLSEGWGITEVRALGKEGF